MKKIFLFPIVFILITFLSACNLSLFDNDKKSDIEILQEKELENLKKKIEKMEEIIESKNENEVLVENSKDKKNKFSSNEVINSGSVKEEIQEIEEIDDSNKEINEEKGLENEIKEEENLENEVTEEVPEIEIKDGEVQTETNKYESEYSITVTEPELLKESLSTDYIIKDSRVEIKGENSEGIEKIKITFENEELSLIDEHILTKFKTGDTTWNYVADTKYSNFANGNNKYTIQGLIEKDGKIEVITEKIITLNAEIIENEFKVPEGNTIEVDFLDKPEEINVEAFRISVGLKFNKVSSEEDRIHKLGNISTGIYKDSELFMIYISPEGPGITEFFRVIKTSNKKLVLLQKESENFDFSDNKLYEFLLDKETTITNLLPPERIEIPNSKYHLFRLNDKDYHFLKEEDYVKAFYANEIEQEVYIEDGLNCLITKNADSTYSSYMISYSFGEEISSGSSHSYPIHKLQVDWDDGTELEGYYTYAPPGGCGGDSCYDIAGTAKTNQVGELVQKGKIASLDELAYIDISTEEITYTVPSFYIKDPFDRYIAFTDQSNIPQVECGKPVIYLYPEVDTDVFVEVSPNGGFSITEPEYGNGWSVRATPESEITNYADSQVYPYLFWEGIGMNYLPPEEGFVVAENEIEEFFREKLAVLGMIEKETDDFLEFWLEEMKKQEKPYYFITFVSQQVFDQLAPLKVTPQPDSIIRVFMDYKGLDEKIEVKPQVLKTPERKGFTVVEWGGALHR